MVRALSCIIAIGLFGCKAKPAPTSNDVAPTAASVTVTALPIPKLAHVALLDPSVTDIRLFALVDGIAVAQKRDSKWGVTVLGTNPHAAVLAAELTSEVQEVVGSTSEIWVTSGHAMSIHHRGAADAKGAHGGDGFTSIGELSKDYWIGILDGGRGIGTVRGTGVLPDPPRGVWLEKMALSGDGRICAFGRKRHDAGETAYAWFAEQVVPIPGNPIVVQPFRSSDRGCFFLAEDRDVQRAHADLFRLTERGLERTHELDLHRGQMASITRDDTLWFWDDGLYRADLRESHFALESYQVPVPTDLDGCKVEATTHIVALTRDDLWLAVKCAQPRRFALLHTEPPRAPETWPAP